MSRLDSEAGGNRMSRDWRDVDTYGDAFDEIHKRRVFIRYVFLIMFMSLMYTAAHIALVLMVDSVGDFFIENSTVILILALIVFLVVYLLFVCVEVVRRKKPWNAIMYFLMVESMSLILLYVMIQYNLKVIAIAVAGTAILCLLMTLVATLAPVDFTGWGGYLIIASLVLMLFGIAIIIVSFFYNTYILMTVYAFLAILLESLYFIFTLQLIFGGKKHAFDPEEYLLGAIVLYIEIVQILIYMLHLVAFCFGND